MNKILIGWVAAAVLTILGGVTMTDVEAGRAILSAGLLTSTIMGAFALRKMRGDMDIVQKDFAKISQVNIDNKITYTEIHEKFKNDNKFLLNEIYDLKNELLTYTTSKTISEAEVSKPKPKAKVAKVAKTK